MKYYCNDIEQYADYFLVMLCNAGATIEIIAYMLEGFSFEGSDGNIYKIEKR